MPLRAGGYGKKKNRGAGGGRALAPLTPGVQTAKIALASAKESEMKQIWAPWRIQYIQAGEAEGCFLCEKSRQDSDAENYILHRGKKNFVILNSYPYNPGHLMVAPYRHVATLEGLARDELLEHFEIVSLSLKVLRGAFNPAGFNIGINVGRVAGAGLEGHIHTHVVPRWQGDTNFMPVLSDVRVLPEALAETYDKLKGKF
jgi:ATP adenylyltransferase